MKHLVVQHRRFLIYCIIGFSGASLDFAIYSLLVKMKLLDYQAANAVGYASGTLLSFVLNAKYNFGMTDKIAFRLLSFLGVAALGYLTSRGLLGLLVGDYGFDKYLSKAATLVVVALLQYNLNRLISFRRSTL